MEIAKTLKVVRRKNRGKAATGRLRAQNMVPGVYYTPGGENILVKAETLPLEKIYEDVGRTEVFNLEIESESGVETHPVMIWQVQRHPYKKAFLHIDYYGVDLDKEVKVDVPLEFTGSAKGVKLGGQLETYRESVRLGSKPLNMPHKIIVDISNLNIGDTITVKDLQLPENVRPIYDHDYAIVGVMAKGKDEEITEEGGAQ